MIAHRVALDPQGFPIAFVDHIQPPEPSAVVHRVMHEIQRPDLIDAVRCRQRLPLTGDDAFLRPAWQVQFQLAVRAMHALMVPRMPLVSQPLETVPEAPAAMTLDGFIERIRNCRIPLHSIDSLSI
jgi:hypothetical protein